MGGSRLYSIFDFTDAVAAGSLTRALTSYAQLDSLGEPAVRVLAMLTRLFRQLLEDPAVSGPGRGPQGGAARPAHPAPGHGHPGGAGPAGDSGQPKPGP